MITRPRGAFRARTDAADVHRSKENCPEARAVFPHALAEVSITIQQVGQDTLIKS
jgi:hypothetical protein